MSTKHRKGRGMMRRPNPSKSTGSMVAVGLLVVVAAGVGIAIAVTSKKDEAKTAAAGTDETNTKPEGAGGEAEDASPGRAQIVRMAKNAKINANAHPNAPRIAPQKLV